jgi:hypothetical protein
MGGDAEQLVADLCRAIGIQHDDEVAGACRETDRMYEFRETVVGEHRIGARHQALRVDGCRFGQSGVAVGDDHALAAGVDEDRRECGRHAGEAHATAAVDLLARKRRQHMVAVRVHAGGTPERAGERRPSAEPGDRDRRIAGAATVDHEEVLGLRLAVGRRKAFHLEDLVEHNDASAQDRRHGTCRVRASRSQPLPPPRHG